MQTPASYREERPWGDFIEFTRNTSTTVKLLVIRPHEALSLQKHSERDEFWRIISGKGHVVIGDKRVDAVIDSEFFIPRGIQHRLEGGAGTESLIVLEISFGTFDDKDIVRLDDRYGRS